MVFRSDEGAFTENSLPGNRHSRKATCSVDIVTITLTK